MSIYEVLRWQINLLMSFTQYLFHTRDEEHEINRRCFCHLDGSCRSQMLQNILHSLQLKIFIFAKAGGCYIMHCWRKIYK